MNLTDIAISRKLLTDPVAFEREAQRILRERSAHNRVCRNNKNRCANIAKIRQSMRVHLKATVRS